MARSNPSSAQYRPEVTGGGAAAGTANTLPGGTPARGPACPRRCRSARPVPGRTGRTGAARRRSRRARHHRCGTACSRTSGQAGHSRPQPKTAPVPPVHPRTGPAARTPPKSTYPMPDRRPAPRSPPAPRGQTPVNSTFTAEDAPRPADPASNRRTPTRRSGRSADGAGQQSTGRITGCSARGRQDASWEPHWRPARIWGRDP
jgi:hypothetical protein